MKILDIFVPQALENYIMRIDEDTSIGSAMQILKTHYQLEGQTINEIVMYHSSSGRFMSEDEKCRFRESGIESGDKIIFIWR